jgi:hypothetical protein
MTRGERGRSGVGRTRNVVAPTSLAGQFEEPYGPMGPLTLFACGRSLTFNQLGLANFFVIRARSAHFGCIARNRPLGADG